jgi:hypothetical protein
VKHVATEELAAIPSAAEDLFIIGGKDAFEKRQREEQQQRDKVRLLLPCGGVWDRDANVRCLCDITQTGECCGCERRRGCLRG